MHRSSINSQIKVPFFSHTVVVITDDLNPKFKYAPYSLLILDFLRSHTKATGQVGYIKCLLRIVFVDATLL